MIIVAQRCGRLGNLLQQFTHLIAFSRETGVPIANPSFHHYQPYFTGTAGDFLARYPKKPGFKIPDAAREFAYKAMRGLDQAGIWDRLPGCTVARIAQNGEMNLDGPEFQTALSTHRHVFLAGGWAFRYWPGFERNLPAIREYFSLVPSHAGKVESFVASARQGAEILVGVHIRQTDFKDHRGGEFYFESGQYARAMQQVLELFPGQRVAFAVCSDAPQTRENFPGLNVHFPIPEHVEDLFVLAGCDFIIGPAISSYCILASMLGNKPRFGITKPGDPFTLQDFKICLG